MTVGLFIAFKITGNYDLISFIVCIFLSFIFFPTLWLITGGTYASIPYYMITNAGIIALLLSGLKRRIVFSIFALIVGLLMVIEYQHPALVVEYDSRLVRYIDLSFGLFTCLFSVVVLIAVLIDSYVKELQNSKRYLAALEEKNREIEAISITDYLTGVFNRRFITSCLSEEIKESHKNKKSLTIAMIDIDNFKIINDTYGHLYGDYILKRIVKTIKSNLRHTDIVGRYGGDEFLIIMRDISMEEGYDIVERVRQKILELKWESDLKITISGGVIEVGDEKMAGLLRKVDKLLYRAKQKNKNLIEKEVVS